MKTRKSLAIAAAALLAAALPTMANSGLIKVTVSADTPYRHVQMPVASTSGAKFQIAPIKTATDAYVTNVGAPVAHVVRPHWR
jgi:hypothetical protein